MKHRRAQNKHPFSELPNYSVKKIIDILLPFYRKVSWQIALLLLLSFLTILISSLIPLSSKIIIDYIVGKKSQATIGLFLSTYGIHLNEQLLHSLFKTIDGFLLLFAGTMALYTLLSVARQVCVFYLRQSLTAKISQSLFSLVTNWELMFLNKFPSGYLTSRIIQDSSSVEQLISSFIPSILSQLVRFSFGLYILFMLSAKMTWICILVAPLYVVLNFMFYKPVKKTNEKASEKRFMANSYVQENLEGIETVKAFNLTSKLSEDFDNILKKLIGIRLRLLTINMLANYSMKLINFSCLLAIIYIGVTEIKSGKMTIGDYIAFMSYMGYLASPVKNLSMSYLSFQPLLTSLRRIYQIFDKKSTDVNSGKSIDHINKVSFLNTCFSYETDQAVLDNFSIHMKAGNIYLGNWPSGSGKTTIARLMLRFIKPDSGELLINEESCSAFSLNSLRKSTSYVSQETYLFNDTIRNNLLIAKPDAPENELTEYLKLACANDFVSALPDGLDSLILDRGKNLSAGQRQRISIARALLKPSTLLILDEPFANIDKTTTERIINNIQTKFSNKIVLIFTHQKLENLPNAITISKNA